MSQNVDFSRSAARIRACFELHEDDVDEALVSALFDAPELSDFIAAFFSQDFSDGFMDDLSTRQSYLPGVGLQLGIPSEMTLGWTYDNYRDDVSSEPHDIRLRTTYALGKEDVLKARAYLADNIEVHIAVLMAKSMVREYIDEWSEYLTSHEKDDDIYCPISDTMMELNNAADGFTFAHDLTPHFASGFAKTGKSFEDINAQDFRGVLVDIFKNQALKSTWEDGLTRCPFSSSFAKLFSKKPILQDDGSLIVENGEFGDLLKFLRDKTLREIDLQSRNDFAAYLELD